MRQWVDNLNYRLELAESTDEILLALAEGHIAFEWIHPFSDGNGRVGRLLVFYLAMKYLGAPVIIAKENRASYIEYLAEQDSQKLAQLFNQSYQAEKERLTQFGQ